MNYFIYFTSKTDLLQEGLDVGGKAGNITFQLCF